MTFSLLLAIMVVAVVIGLAITVGGVVMIVIGALRMLRKPTPPKPHEPRYSQPVAYDGPEQVPSGFEDSPRWVDADVTSDSPEVASHAAPYSSTDLRAGRRVGGTYLAVGVVLLVIGIVFVTQAWAFLS